MEEIAEYNLKDLINRNLVRVDKLKSCRTHDMFRDFYRNDCIHYHLK